MTLRISTPYRLLQVACLWAACQGIAYADTWKVNLQDADMLAFINEVSNITGSNFVPDPRINGKVTVISHRAMDEKEIYQLFLSVMKVNGIVAVEKNGIIELKPDNLAKQSGLPVDLSGSVKGEQMVTRIVYLKNTQANEILSALRPLMPQSAHAAAVPSINALVLSDRADSLYELTQMIRSLDVAGDQQLSVIDLRHTTAERVMELISGLSGKGDKSQFSNKATVVADSKSDRILVSGNTNQVARIRRLIRQIDTLPSRSLSSTRVFKLNYANASHVSSVLQGLLSGSSAHISSVKKSSVSKASLGDTKAKAGKKDEQATSQASATPKGASQTSSLDKYGTPFSIVSDETRNVVYIDASNQTMSKASKIIKDMDVADVQVLIQAAIIEISGDDVEQLGVQWALGSNRTGYGLINFDNVGVSASGLATSILSRSPQAVSSAASAIAGTLLGVGSTKKASDGSDRFYGAILQAINKTTSANLLSTPSITTVNNKEASILVGQNVPFVTGSYTAGGTGGSNPFQTVERQDVGIQLNVIPRVSSDGMVTLDVSQEVSSVVSSDTSNINGLITNKSLINTTVMAKDGQTVALGGLMRENSNKSEQKVPQVGDVPFLGRLFRSNDQSTQKSNLIIFLQPTIIRDGGVIPSITEMKGNKIKTMQLTIEPNGTIRQIPLSGNQGWYAQEVKLDNAARLMTINPVTANNYNPEPLTLSQKDPMVKVEVASPEFIPSAPTKRFDFDDFDFSDEFKD